MKWKIIGAILVLLLISAFVAISNLSYGQESAWIKAKNADTIAAFDRFRSRSPDSPHAGEASERLAILHDDAEWRTANDKGTLDAFTGFLDSHANSGHLLTVAQRMSPQMSYSSMINPAWSKNDRMSQAFCLRRPIAR
jgi:hypothetical protein